jgi:hypothetical protein
LKMMNFGMSAPADALCHHEWVSWSLASLTKVSSRWRS